MAGPPPLDWKTCGHGNITATKKQVVELANESRGFIGTLSSEAGSLQRLSEKMDTAINNFGKSVQEI